MFVRQRIDSVLTCWLALVLCPVASIVQAQDQPYANYQVQMSDDLQTLAINVCFNTQPPRFLQAHDDDADRRLQLVQRNGEESWFKQVNNNRISLRDMNKDDCLDYQVDIRPDNWQGRRSRMRQQNLDDENIRISAQTWLWLPRKSEVQGEITITFTHRNDQNVSTAWPLIERTPEQTVFRLGDTPYAWNRYTVLGDIRMEQVSVPGANLRLAIMKGEPEANYADVKKWIRHGAEAVTLAYGRFPLPAPQIVVMPVGDSRRDAVLFGHVVRGGGTSSHLYIDQTRPIQEHINDWTLTHELSHMMHPYMGDAGSWLAEGLASYYQNVLQARVGTITHERAWQKLHEGFQRGIKQTYDGVTLEDASTNRTRSGTMRIYWSGAAITLLADLQLRERGDSLDHVLSQFQACCLPSNDTWRPLEFVQKLDALSRSSVFNRLYHNYVESDRFPELDEAYKKLGIYIRNGNVTFTDDESAKRLRLDIMNRPDQIDQAAIQAVSKKYL